MCLNERQHFDTAFDIRPYFEPRQEFSRMTGVQVAKLGEKEPTGLLLAAVGAPLKLGTVFKTESRITPRAGPRHRIN